MHGRCFCNYGKSWSNKANQESAICTKAPCVWAERWQSHGRWSLLACTVDLQSAGDQAACGRAVADAVCCQVAAAQLVGGCHKSDMVLRKSDIGSDILGFSMTAFEVFLDDYSRLFISQ